MEQLVRPSAALALLGACVVAALVMAHPLALALLAVILLVLLLRTPWRRARLFLLGIAVSSFGLFVIWPLTEHKGSSGTARSCRCSARST
jgi:hypothetical protein